MRSPLSAANAALKRRTTRTSGYTNPGTALAQGVKDYVVTSCRLATVEKSAQEPPRRGKKSQPGTQPGSPSRAVFARIGVEEPQAECWVNSEIDSSPFRDGTDRDTGS